MDQSIDRWHDFYVDGTGIFTRGRTSVLRRVKQHCDLYPVQQSALSTLYIATITTGVQDMFGNFLASDFVWTFTTGANPCQPPAPPISVTPPNGSVGVCPNIVVAATFPQSMDPSTINTPLLR